MDIKTYSGYLAYALNKQLGQIVWAIAESKAEAIALVSQQAQTQAEFIYTQDRQKFYSVEHTENNHKFLELFDEDNNPVFDAVIPLNNS